MSGLVCYFFPVAINPRFWVNRIADQIDDIAICLLARKSTCIQMHVTSNSSQTLWRKTLLQPLMLMNSWLNVNWAEISNLMHCGSPRWQVNTLKDCECSWMERKRNKKQKQTDSRVVFKKEHRGTLPTLEEIVAPVVCEKHWKVKTTTSLSKSRNALLGFKKHFFQTAPIFSFHYHLPIHLFCDIIQWI